MSLPPGGLVDQPLKRGASRITRIATLVTLACAWSSATTSAIAQPSFGAYDNGFSAFADNGAPLASPDIAVSPDLIVAVDSGEVAWYSKNTQPLGLESLTGPGGLWSWVSGAGALQDVSTVYNSNSQRFIVAALARLDNGQMHLNYAVSNTADPDDGWEVRHFWIGDLQWMSMGAWKDGIFLIIASPAPTGSWYSQATLAELLQPNVNHFISGQVSSGLVRFACNNADGTGDERMIVANALDNDLRRINLAGTNPALGLGPIMNRWIDVPRQAIPPLAPQLGGAPIDFGGMSFRSAKVVNDSCWLAQAVGKDGRSVVRWYEIALNGWPLSGQVPSLRQTGEIDPGVGTYAFLPDIAVDSQGNAAIVFSISSPTQHVQVARAVRFADDPLNEFRPHHVFLTSPEAVDSGAWGAYVGIEADPGQPGVFWSHTPYSLDGWNTWISKITLAADDDPPSDGPRLYVPDDGFIHNVIPILQWNFSDLESGYRVEISTRPDFVNGETFSSGPIVGTSYEIPEGVVQCNTRYYWRVVAETSHGDMMSSPDSRWFEKRLVQDLNGDGIVDSADLGMLIRLFNTSTPGADFNNDGIVNSADLGSLISVFGQVCN
ncbi:MAG: hypothetical protein H6813_00490 [Phycisphaeraceae bacterium]|nr:hypothetical protein [Phycisphaeraceae bacterium]MCB9847437.1 hypothetical protein [Phycisphaeraceae bacterium]